MRRHVCEGGTRLLLAGRRRCRWSPGPDQDFVLLVDGHPLGVNEFGLEILQVLVVEVEAAFERPIGDPSLALEQIAGLGEDLVECHDYPPQRYGAAFT